MNDCTWPTLTEPLPLANGIVHVVRLGLLAESGQIERLRSLLSPDELVRAERYKFDEPRRRFIVCRAALRQVLGACLSREASSLVFAYGPHGKPMLVGDVNDGPQPPTTLSSDESLPDFSVSHSADLALIAIAVGRRIGVDIERRDPKVRIHKLATRFFSSREASELASLPEPEQLAGFYRGWTSKESYLKATGLGLSFPLSRFTVALDPRQPARLLEVVDQPHESARWRMASLDVAIDFSAAILIEAASNEPITIQQWSLPQQSLTNA